ncbi:MAG: ketoacyl-ACP synthase III [Saprospiraceae bacterium]|nr:ketoacyl-ACP synthase III [Saprospiraceae bacterium]MBK6564078.1 ketoacyl-ACP synthase III [Saprospiraceae bacterium]MBK7525344.1 ketoacyl-ACP synthase III [Saprospiraceae bacterium]MBK8372285.1 ketoacyl-ACP synthase III [Saprospiraceae bacterium]MBK8547585.1 ketoacyl-ACP synthase III [Saprospiraceae bacterium]
MSKIRAVITAVGGFVPEDVLTNFDLEKMVDTTDEWITTRTGIKERRILKGEGKATSYMGVKVVEEILKKRGISPDEIDMLICATVTGDMVFPDTANTILDKVGAKNAFGYDINAACSGFLYALTTGSKFIESGTYKKVIVVGADMMSSIVNYNDRTTCIIFGDGGGGFLLEPSVEEGYGVIDSILKADGSGRAYLHMKAGGSLKPASSDSVTNMEHYVYQDGKPVFKAAVTGMVSTIKDLLERNQLSIEDIDWLVPHQANMRIINSVAEMLDFPKEKVMINIHKFGNTTAGTLPLCIWEYENRLKKGDKIILTAFGGGFTWGSTYLVWNK